MANVPIVSDVREKEIRTLKRNKDLFYHALTLPKEEISPSVHVEKP